ncbi:NAD(P)-binding domain-containing protein [Candidatus Desulfosporosinus nitrosoreducens]|uniref:NAD(P)-binding domain-containing protein n=1 Tax=Candidatus Desulfosporosinus nitrosoreducens TaxID=3401928 RepID=UPI00280BD3D1|nr:NAD(P)-binding domain-containing protein [Desulfosporosinus sp. PR]
MGMSIGFIGTGVITSALVTGFCSGEDLDHRIYLSPRNAERASELAGKFKNVTVAGSNQEVLDKSEWVVLAVVPKLGEDIIRPLTFRADHRVINLIADRKLSEIASWIGKTRTLVHMVPLPFASRRIGPIALYPNDLDVANLFAPLGNIIGVNDEKQIEALLVITALMSSYYNLLWEVVKWGESNGLSMKESTEFTTSFFEALSSQARYDGDLSRLVEEMTPGGLNEMALHMIKGQDGFQPWVRALEPVLRRIRK